MKRILALSAAVAALGCTAGPAMASGDPAQPSGLRDSTRGCGSSERSESAEFHGYADGDPVVGTVQVAQPPSTQPSP